MLDSGEGTTSGAADQAHPVVTWEIAPLRAAALRTERAVNKRWQTVRATIIGSALLLGVIGSAAALSLNSVSSLPGGMGFLSAAAASSVTSTAEQDVRADEARDGVADDGAPSNPADPVPPAAVPPAAEGTPPTDSAPAAAPPVVQPEPERATPTATAAPEPEPAAAPAPAPAATPSSPPVPTPAENSGGLLGDLLDLLLPGLFG